jgi:tetratricopeptide (TPR) repeat protein
VQAGPEQQHGLARSLNNLGMTLRDRGDYDDARDCFQEALSMRQEIEDADGVSRTLNNLGQLASAQGDAEAAVELHTRALEIRRGLGDRHGVARTSGTLALALAGLGRLNEARALLQEAASIRGSLGDRYGEAETALALARVEIEQADPRAALEQAAFATHVAEDLGVPRLAAQGLVVQGETLTALEEPGAASAAWTSALEQFRAIGATGEAESVLRRLAE